MWSFVEQLLDHPDVDIILDRLSNYLPDLSSDRESDRDSIIHEAEQLLTFSLEIFAESAEEKLEMTKPEAKFGDLFRADDFFLTFNYSHKIERLYGVPSSRAPGADAPAGEAQRARPHRLFAASNATTNGSSAMVGPQV